MMRVALRFGPLLIALVVLLLAYGSWTFGTPPTWTLFGPRAQTQILSAKVDSYRIGNGTTRHEPVVEVSWPPEGGTATRLGGVLPEFFDYRSDGAAAITEDYRVGETIGVRVFDGAPYADRIGWFGLGHAVFLSLMSLVALAIAFLFFKLFEPDRRRS